MAGVIWVPNENDEIEPSRSWLGVPIVVGERVLGVVRVESYRPQAFDERSVRLLSTLAASMGGDRERPPVRGRAPPDA